MDDVISSIPPQLLKVRRYLNGESAEDTLRKIEQLRTMLTIAGQMQFLDECDELAKALKRGNKAIAEDILTKLQKKITGFEEKAVINIEAQKPRTKIFI
jgi:hypothetical protein